MLCILSATFLKSHQSFNLIYTDMKSEESNSFVTACYTDGKDAPSLFLFDS